MGGVNQRYSWVGEGVISEEIVFVCLYNVHRVSPNRNYERGEFSRS